MWGDTKQASSATTSLVYITVGSLISIWMVIYYLYLRNHNGSDIAYLYVAGFFFSGVVLFLIGLAVGRIGGAARPAETAPVPPQVIAQTAVPNTLEPVAAPATPIIAAAPVVTPPVAAPPVQSVPQNPPAVPAATNQLVPNA